MQQAQAEAEADAVLLGDDVLEEQAEPMVFQVGGAWAWRPATARELFDLLTKAFSDNDTHVNMMPRAFHSVAI